MHYFNHMFFELLFLITDLSDELLGESFFRLVPFKGVVDGSAFSFVISSVDRSYSV